MLRIEARRSRPAAVRCGKRGLRQEDGAFEIDVDDFVDRGFRHRAQRTAARDTGVVDQHVEAAEARHRLRHHALAVGALRHVARDGEDPAAGVRR